MTIEVALLVSIISVSFSVFFGLKSAKRTDAKAVEEKTAENIRLNMKLDEIGRNVAEIKDELRLQKQAMQDVIERVAKVEASARQAHHRLDRMEGKEYRNDG